MRTKKLNKKILAAVFVAAGILTGCSGDSQSTLNPIITEPPAEATATPAPTEQPGGEQADSRLPGGENHPIGTRTVVDGKMQSYLTGEWKDASVVKRRNMAVMINNLLQGLPQYGISAASVIYEAPVEKGYATRLMAYFEDYDDLDRIGTVRSSRDYFVYEAMTMDSIYCNWGLAIPFVADLINSDRVDNVSQSLEGIEVGSPEAFGRVQRGGSYTLEHTGYMFIDGYNQALENRGYRKEYKSDFPGAFRFADDGYLATYDSYPDAVRIYPGGLQSNSGGYGNNNPCFAYNEDDKLYYRTQYRSEHIDEMNGEQLAVTNVVFKICHGEYREPVSYGYLAFQVHGTGDAVIFTNGKVIEGTWTLEGEDGHNVYKDKNGNEIVLNQGKTWVCCIWEEYSQYMSWE